MVDNAQPLSSGSASLSAASPPEEPAFPAGTRRRRRWPWVVLVLLLAGAGALALFGRGEGGKEVQTARIERVDKLLQKVSAPGTVEAREAVDIQAEIAGVILELPVRAGDRVEKGQVLVRIDPSQTRADLKAMEATLAAALADAKGQEVTIARARAALAGEVASAKAARAERLQARARLERSRIQLDQVRQLQKKGIETADSLDAALSQVKVDQAQMEALTARVDQFQAQVETSRLEIDRLQSAWEAARRRAEAARANMERARDSLAKTTIYAPLSGLITHLHVEAGERAVPGILSNPQATLMTIADLSVLEAHLEVDETDIIQVLPENPVEVTVDALPDDPLAARITEIGNAPVTSLESGLEGKNFLVKVRLLDPPSSLRPGMSCEGEITTARREKVLVVPIQALARREVRVDARGNYLSEENRPRDRERRGPLTRERGPRKDLEGLFLLDPDNRARFHPVTTGISGEMDIEIEQAGLAGREVIIGPFKTLRNLEEGDRVRVDNSGFNPFRRRHGAAEEE